MLRNSAELNKGRCKMKKDDIKVGGRYVAKVSGRLTVVRVQRIDAPRDVSNKYRMGTRYQVRNERTGRETTFRSASKFRAVAGDGSLPDRIAKADWSWDNIGKQLSQAEQSAAESTTQLSPEQEAQIISSDPAEALAKELMSNKTIPEALPIGLRAQLRKRFVSVIRSHLQGMEMDTMSGN